MHSRGNSREQRRSGRNSDAYTMSSHMLEELEMKANDPASKMDVNLKRTYHNMRRFVKSANPIGPFGSQTIMNRIKRKTPSIER